MISCAPLVSQRTEQLLIVDIGGGSTELVWIDLEDVEPKERPRAIMRLGGGFANPQPGAHGSSTGSRCRWGLPRCVTSSEDVEDDQGRFALMLAFRGNAVGFHPYSLMQDMDESFQVIGTSGTVTTVAASHLGLRRYDRTKVDGLGNLGADRPGHSRLSGAGAGRSARRSAHRAGTPRADHVEGGDPADLDAGLADAAAVGRGSRFCASGCYMRRWSRMGCWPRTA